MDDFTATCIIIDILADSWQCGRKEASKPWGGTLKPVYSTWANSAFFFDKLGDFGLDFGDGVFLH